jgi:hypothetical protein
MLSDLTPEEFRSLAAALHLAQQTGEASPPGEISYRELAEWYHTTPADIKNEELAALEKLRNLLHL